MEINKSQIVDLLRVRGRDDLADQAATELPPTVDTERDAALLARFDLDEQAVVGGLEDTAGLGERDDTVF